MHQALRSVSVLPDDEQAYLQHHKNEAEKRLMARREKDREERQQEIAGTNGRMSGRPVGVMRKVTKSPAPSSSSSSSSPITFNDTLTTALGGGMCNGNVNGSGGVGGSSGGICGSDVHYSAVDAHLISGSLTTGQSNSFYPQLFYIFVIAFIDYNCTLRNLYKICTSSLLPFP